MHLNILQNSFPFFIFLFYFVHHHFKTINMKKTLIASLVGGIIIFLWQFLTWGPLNLHRPQQQYTPKQDSILSYLGTQFNEDGAYMLPNYPQGISTEEMDKQMKAMEGKPWATVVYHKSMPGMNKMLMNMGRSLLINILVVWLLCWLLVKIPSASFGTIFTGSLFAGLIVFFNAPYTLHIWFGSFDLIAHFIDMIVSWGVVGLWLGWWLRRSK
jgi:hypothetical protein